jgi:uncharacterized protein (TIGR02265 family)
VPEKLIFDHTVESLLRTLDRPIPPEQIKELDALGIDLSKPLQPAYPLEVYSVLIGFIGRQRFPRLSEQEADFEVGRAFIEAYTTQTMMGKALKGLLRVIGPHRGLERMSRTFRSANNYTETRLEKLGQTSYQLWFNFALRPSYFAGMVHGTLMLCGLKQLVVKVLDAPRPEELVHVSWEP